MISTSTSSQLISFLFLNTLDLEYSKNVLKNTYLKLHSQNENQSEEVIFKNTLKKILSKKIDINKVLLEDFKKSCEIIFKNNNHFNFQNWFLFFKRSIQSERETFILSQILKLSDIEIADLQNLTIGTVRSRISSCYNKFTEVIKNG